MQHPPRACPSPSATGRGPALFPRPGRALLLVAVGLALTVKVSSCHDLLAQVLWPSPVPLAWPPWCSLGPSGGMRPMNGVKQTFLQAPSCGTFLCFVPQQG